MFLVIHNIILNDHIAQWTRDIERIEGVNGSGRNKLRSYRLFKTTYQVERYCSMHMSSSHRSAFAKFRCGVAPMHRSAKFQTPPKAVYLL